MQAERRCEKCGQMIPWGEPKCPACGEGGRYLWSVPRNTLLLLSFLLLLILFAITTIVVKAYRAKQRALARQWYASGERELTACRAEAALVDFRSALVYSPNDSLVEFQLAHALAAAEADPTPNTSTERRHSSSEGVGLQKLSTVISSPFAVILIPPCGRRICAVRSG